VDDGQHALFAVQMKQMTECDVLRIVTVDRLSYGLIIYFNDGRQALYPTESLHSGMDDTGVIQFSLTDTLIWGGE
jgi:hypothetical protein